MHYYYEAPYAIAESDAPVVFLAGTISGSENWQKQVADALSDLKCTVLNPRRPDFPMKNPNAAKEQIQWEFSSLWYWTDIFTMWFDKATVGPICLYEYGAHMSRQACSLSYSHIVVGMDMTYPRMRDVEIQTDCIRSFAPNMFRNVLSPFAYSLDTHIKQIRAAVKDYETSGDDKFISWCPNCGCRRVIHRKGGVRCCQSCDRT